MQQEIIDIFDADMNPLGTTTRREVHKHGYWHQTFHCWVVSREGDKRHLLFQLRHPDKEFCPNLLDTSAAGHLLAGETPQDGVRELQEELGLTVPFSGRILPE